MIKRVLKIILTLIMLIGITLSVANFISTENQALNLNPEGDNPNGTLIIHSDGSTDCQGPPLNC